MKTKKAIKGKNMFTQVKYYFKKLIRQGYTFNKILKELHESQYYSPEQLVEFQNKKLRRIIKHCYKNVPYYRELFDKLNLKPEDIQTKEDLNKLPFMDKYIVKENYDNLIAKNHSSFLCNVGTTSGTTGTPGRFLRDYYAINFENAALNRFWQNAGDKNFKRVTIRENVVTPLSQDKPPFWEENWADKELIMSSYHLLQKNAQIYIDKIIEYNPKVMHTQPPTAYMLAKFFENINHNLNLIAIFTSSENLSSHQREFIEKVFKCKIYDEYGQAERVAAIHQCEKGTYHIVEDYSIVELIKEDNDTYQICGTHLHNYAMPLLRYKTGDFILTKENQCTCKKHFREIENIEGRTIYYILTPEHNKIVNLGVVTSEINSIIETQFVQETLNKLIINLVITDKFSLSDENKLIKNAKEYISPSMNVEIKRVDSIPRTSNGKFINVIRKFEVNEKDFFEVNNAQ